MSDDLSIPENPFEKALEVLDNLGWHQEQLQSEMTGRVCILGACAIARGDFLTNGYPAYPSRDFAAVVADAIRAAGFDVSPFWESPVDKVAHWNDEPERTQEDVRLVLKHAAAAWTS